MQTTSKLHEHRQAWTAGLFTGTTYHDVHLAELRRTSNIDAIEMQEGVFPKPSILLRETRLQMAVMQQAIHDLRGRKETLIRDAVKWIINDDADHAFSFITVCEAFGVRPEAARKELLAGIDVEAALSYRDLPRRQLEPHSYEPLCRCAECRDEGHRRAVENGTTRVHNRTGQCPCGCGDVGRKRGYCHGTYKLAIYRNGNARPSDYLLRQAAAWRLRKHRAGAE